MEEIDERLKVLDKKTDKILFYLESDNKTKRKGLVETVEIVKDRVAVLETRNKIEKAKNGILGAFFGGLTAIVAIVIKEYITKN